MNYQAGKTKEAEDLWSDGVSKNDGPSMFWLASLYLASSSIRVKRAEIKALLERANALGQLRAKHRLGVMLMVGRYGIINIPRGVFLFLRFLISGFKVALRDPTSRRLW
jgi:TPR repeat protein